MTRILVVNHAHSEMCGIHDIGKRIYHCLQHSTEIEEVRYAECDGPGDFDAACRFFDMVIVNHRDDLTPWAATPIDTPKFAVLHQYEETTADARARALLDRFDGVLALDPLLHPTEPRLHAVGRPIPESVPSIEDGGSVAPATQPWIGSFGFAFPHKGFVDVAAEVASLGRRAVYNLHMPEAFFNGAGGAPLYTAGVIEAVTAELSNHGVNLVHSAEHLAERELVMRLAMNDVNCLFYAPGQPDAGLSSALDYLIAARRPMLLSEADMFRHAWYGGDGPTFGATRWPTSHLGDVLGDYAYRQLLADELYAFHHGRFTADIERIVAAL